jgi:dihydropteroate synthase
MAAVTSLRWQCGPHSLECGPRTLVMGVLNVTPDSFSDGGRHFDPETAVAAGIRMVADGADILDLGGESTRPGARAVPWREEADRVLPVVKRLAVEVGGGIPVSIDTRKPEVAREAIEAGATIVNDVTGGADPAMLEAVRGSGAGFVLMHMRGDPSTMAKLTEYGDVVVDVRDALRQRLQAALQAGIPFECLCVDPGLGFAKTTPQSLQLMRRVGEFGELGRPILAGPSRKSFIGHVLDAEVTDRVEGTAGAVAWLAGNGAHVVRVHDVREMVRVVRMVDAIRHA